MTSQSRFYPPFTKRVWKCAVQRADRVPGKVHFVFDLKAHVVTTIDHGGRRRNYRYDRPFLQWYAQMFLWTGIRATRYQMGMTAYRN